MWLLPATAPNTCRSTTTLKDVWQHYGPTAAEAQSAGMNPQMFNSFLDGTKSAIEMVAIANATGLDVPLTPARDSLKIDALPIGLAHRVKLTRDIAHGAVVTWNDVEIGSANDTVATRRAMEERFATEA